MKASVALAPIKVDPQPVPVSKAVPVQRKRVRANSSCLVSVARFLLWATRNG
ncbi:hypothetical protein ACFSCW_09060 [Sphingomonas tabacisoli]|uniref:Uncharacterized protein n=1 Tax=Sphingomonas tabacisoli TaxID=2249466 RepID=A0ABW4I1Z9_9SPHN